MKEELEMAALKFEVIATCLESYTISELVSSAPYSCLFKIGLPLLTACNQDWGKNIA